MVPVVLTIGALDPLGADGIAADLRAFAALRVHGATLPTAIAGEAGGALPAALVARQIRHAFAEFDIRAVKTGVPGPAALIEAVAEALAACCAEQGAGHGAGHGYVPVIVDPCLAARDGARAEDDVVAACRERLLPLSTVVTPNLAEAALLTGSAPAGTLGQMLGQGERLVTLGCAHAVVTGGHGAATRATDILVSREAPPLAMGAARLDRDGLHGLSATFAAAIAAGFARGDAAVPAVQYAKLFVTGAIAGADRYDPGRGPRAVNAFHRMWMVAGGGPDATNE